MSSTDQPASGSNEAFPKQLEQLLAQKEFAQCVMLCHIKDDTKPLAARQALAIAEIHLAAARQDWIAVLKLTSPQNGRDDIKKAARKQVMLVHPDKCRLPASAEAFKLIMAATERVATSQTDEASGEAKDGPKWWQVWDETPAEVSRKRQREQEDHSELKGQILEECRQLSTQELKDRVSHLQTSILRPAPDSSEAKLTRTQRQELLRDARHLLAGRISDGIPEEVSDERTSRTAGGFF